MAEARRLAWRWGGAALVAGAAALAGCGGKGGGGGGGGNVTWSTPAPKEAPQPPPAKAVAIDPALQAVARKELEAALASNDPSIRAHAIEAVAETSGSQGKEAYLKALGDPEALVRGAACKAIGQHRVTEARAALLRMVDDPHPLVRIAVRFALHRLGDTSRTKELEQTARDPLVWQNRAETAVVLGMLGEPTAVRVLRPMLRDREPAVRIQVAEALWRLGDESGLRNLVAATASGYPDDQMIALMALTHPRDGRVMGHLRAALTADYPEVQVVAARAMGVLGSDAGYAIAVEAAKSRDVNQRHRAALALGDIGRADAQPVLGELLKDRESADVRLAAARSLLRLGAPAVAAGGVRSPG